MAGDLLGLLRTFKISQRITLEISAEKNGKHTSVSFRSKICRFPSTPQKNTVKHKNWFISKQDWKILYENFRVFRSSLSYSLSFIFPLFPMIALSLSLARFRSRSHFLYVRRWITRMWGISDRRKEFFDEDSSADENCHTLSVTTSSESSDGIFYFYFCKN